MTEQQTQSLIFQLAAKVDDLESKIRRLQSVVANIDGNTAQTANMVRELVRKSR